MSDPGHGRDTAALMRFNAGKRSAVVAYGLWCLLFFGFLGIHRMYLGRVFSGVLMLLLGWLCLLLTWLSLGILFLVWVLPGLWAVIDLFLIPGMTRGYNEDLIRRLTRRLYGSKVIVDRVHFTCVKYADGQGSNGPATPLGSGLAPLSGAGRGGRHAA